MAKRSASPEAAAQDAKVPRTEAESAQHVPEDAKEAVAHDTEPQGRQAVRRVWLTQKRKVAIFFGYCGTGYSGLQM